MGFAIWSKDDLSFLEKVGVLCLPTMFTCVILWVPGLVLVGLAVGLEFFFGRGPAFYIVSAIGLILIAPSSLSAVIFVVVAVLNEVIGAIGGVVWWLHQRITQAV